MVVAQEVAPRAAVGVALLGLVGGLAEAVPLGIVPDRDLVGGLPQLDPRRRCPL